MFEIFNWPGREATSFFVLSLFNFLFFAPLGFCVEVDFLFFAVTFAGFFIEDILYANMNTELYIRVTFYF